MANEELQKSNPENTIIRCVLMGMDESGALVPIKTSAENNGGFAGAATNLTLTGAVTGSGSGSIATTLAVMPALTVKANGTNASAVPTDIAAATDGQVFQRSTTNLLFGAVDLSKPAAVSNTLPVANGGLNTPTAPTLAQIPIATATTAYTPTTLSGVITVNSTGVTAFVNNAVTDAALRQGAAQTIIGRSANSTGNVADISLAVPGKGIFSRGNTLAAGFSANMVYSAGTTYTVSGDDAGRVLVLNSAGASITVTLPTITSALDGMIVTMLKVGGSNIVTINRGGANVIGASSATSNVLTAQNSFVTLCADLANSVWWVAAATDYLSNPVASYTISGVGSAGAYGDVTSLSIQPGTWELQGLADVTPNGGTFSSVSQLWAYGTASGTSSAGVTGGTNVVFFPAPTGSNSVGATMPTQVITVASATTYYLKSNYTYTVTTPAHRGTLAARRVG